MCGKKIIAKLAVVCRQLFEVTLRFT